MAAVAQPDAARRGDDQGRAGPGAPAAVDRHRVRGAGRRPGRGSARPAAGTAGLPVLLGRDPVDHRLRRHRPGQRHRAACQHADPDADQGRVPDPADRHHARGAGRTDPCAVARLPMEVEDGRSHRRGGLRHEGPQRPDHAAGRGRAGDLGCGGRHPAARRGGGEPGRSGRRHRRCHPAAGAGQRGDRDGGPTGHRRRPGRHGRAHRADRPPAVPGSADRRGRPRIGERAAAAPERGQPGRGVLGGGLACSAWPRSSQARARS